jgi:hypothetical protein
MIPARISACPFRLALSRMAVSSARIMAFNTI